MQPQVEGALYPQEELVETRSDCALCTEEDFAQPQVEGVLCPQEELVHVSTFDGSQYVIFHRSLLIIIHKDFLQEIIGEKLSQ